MRVVSKICVWAILPIFIAYLFNIFLNNTLFGLNFNSLTSEDIKSILVFLIVPFVLTLVVKIIYSISKQKTNITSLSILLLWFILLFTAIISIYSWITLFKIAFLYSAGIVLYTIEESFYRRYSKTGKTKDLLLFIFGLILPLGIVLAVFSIINNLLAPEPEIMCYAITVYNSRNKNSKNIAAYREMLLKNPKGKIPVNILDKVKSG